MKIGIVTQQIVGNYGGILQNFALQTALRKMGHEPFTIDYRESYMSLREYRKRKWRYIRRTVKFKHPEPVGPRYRQRSSEEIENFVSKYISVTPPVTDYADKKVRKRNFDCLIVGSDQVWRPIYNVGVMEDMFLRFARDWNVKRIAYAASFGTGEREFAGSLLEEAKGLIQKFDYVSVREESGVGLFESYFGCKPKWVADPTLLLGKSDYERLIADKFPADNCAPGSPFIFKYVLDNKEETDKALGTLSEKLSMPDIRSVADQDKTVSIERWLRYLRDAGLVLTDSFHGTIFSIIFHVPFVSVCNKDRGADRFYAILSRLGLENRLVSEDTPGEEIIKVALSPVDWEMVDRKLASFKEESLRELKNALEN